MDSRREAGVGGRRSRNSTAARTTANYADNERSRWRDGERRRRKIDITRKNVDEEEEERMRKERAAAAETEERGEFITNAASYYGAAMLATPEQSR